MMMGQGSEPMIESVVANPTKIIPLKAPSRIDSNKIKPPAFVPMPSTLKPKLPKQKRPKWIPAHITENWDTDPYAYQTEEELMAAGGLHGELLGDIWELTSKLLRKRDLMLLMDIFMLFEEGIDSQDRNAPDLLVVPCKPEDTAPSSYNLATDPTPVCAFEVVSPSSRKKDKDNPKFTIEKLGIPLCVVIDRVNYKGELRLQAELSVWQRDPKTGKAVKMKPNLKKEYRLAPLNMSIGVHGSSVYFVDGETGEVLRDIEMEREGRRAAEERAMLAEERVEEERLARETERLAREAAEERAKAERLEREAAEERVAKEKAEREKAEAEIAKLRALLEQHRLST
ncbi:MAG: Uma2 family endonuclease [Chloroflexota bacterium]